MTSGTVTHLRYRRRGRVALRKLSWQKVWRISTEELALRVAAAPSRQDNPRGPRPRSDYVNGLANVLDKVWNHVNTEDSATFRTTWLQLGVSLGMEKPENAEKTLRRWLEMLAEIGVLTFGGETDEFGRFLCLRITVLEPPRLVSGSGPCSSAGSRGGVSRAVRRRETHAQKVARRTAPYRRRSGRGSVPRFDFFWALKADSVVPGRRSRGPSGHLIGDQAEVNSNGELIDANERQPGVPGSTAAELGATTNGGAALKAEQTGTGRGEVAETPSRASELPPTESERETVLVTRSEVTFDGGAWGLTHADVMAMKPAELAAWIKRWEATQPQFSAAEPSRAAVRARWAEWARRRDRRLAQLCAVRRPSYADIEEGFALAVCGGPDDDPWVDHQHARAATRAALEREAKRYDLYASRLLLGDGIRLPSPTAMCFLIADYRHGLAVSPGAALSFLTKLAKQLRRQWEALHPELKDRRRAARLVRQAEQRASCPIAFRVKPRLNPIYRDGLSWDNAAAVRDDHERHEGDRLLQLEREGQC